MIAQGGMDVRVRTNVFIGKLVRETDALRLVLDRAPVNDRLLELLLDRFVDRNALVAS